MLKLKNTEINILDAIIWILRIDLNLYKID